MICFQISLKEKHVLFHEYVLPSFIDVHFWYSTFFLYRKSTFFNVLTKSVANAENFPFCTIDPNESIQTLLDAFLKVFYIKHFAKKYCLKSYISLCLFFMYSYMYIQLHTVFVVNHRLTTQIILWIIPQVIQIMLGVHW